MPPTIFPPQKDYFLQARKTGLENYFPTQVMMVKAELSPLWNLNRKEERESTSRYQVEKTLEEVQGCHVAESDANPERQEERP